ncbi:late embryogenesis abundant protein At1g64065-like [Salvia hispanica]|uniref:late embryogenesis abundant protein At1g64065-like n=1 Tax=Salvia hispanica TaxID=49212 RepID=UPI0020095878|nr:late embryogenesis abundant protein At1g64065-like [Salvia hispanica]
MAEKEQQSPLPLAPARYGLSRSDTEAPDCRAAEQRRININKRRKCLLYVFLFALLQTGVILLFTFTVMRIRTPKFRVLGATLELSNSSVALPGNGSLRAAMTAELGVKNSNFGRFRYGRTAVYFFYDGAQVGEAAAGGGRANWRSTERLKVKVDVNVADSAQLERDLAAGVVALTSRAEMRGDVRLAMLFEKKRSAEMNCSMEIVTGNLNIRNIVCD